MVYSTSENEKSHSTRLKSTKEKTPKKSSTFKSVDKISSKYVNLHSETSKKETINKSNTLCNEPYIETNKIHLKKDNDFQLCELKLSLKRIDETNYMSILSPSSLKINTNKSLQRHNDTDNEEENYEPNEQSRRISVSSSCFDESDCSTIDSLESIAPKRNLRASISTTPCKLNKIDNNLEFDTPRRIRKPVNHFGDTVDLNEILIDNSPTKSKLSRRSSSNIVNTSKSVTPKRERKSVNRFGDSVNFNEMKCTQKTSSSLSTCKTNTSSKSMPWNGHDTNEISKLVAELINNDSDNIEENCKLNKRTLRGSVSTTPGKSNKVINTLEFENPKRTRKPVDRFGESVDWNETSLVNTSANSKCTKITSSSTSKKSNNMVNSLASITPEYTRETSPSLSTPCKSSSMMNTFETPKRNRKSVNRFGVSVDSNEVEDTITPRINKKRRNMSINEDDDINFDINVWETPVNKHLRLSMTPTSCSGSKVRRSILQDIPENKEIEVISTPKTPKKTKAHVKNLTASVSRRSDSGVRVPCSPLEKARASLHLHAAPKHLPCREIEFKSIHSYLARKISDELTGSMYISGVPGTGKTATVKRVIDSLNSDVIMKHSFKFIEINGLRLANPHQAFSVIWKELTTETVSSSRAQALLNDYFSGKKVREFSTILLVDEVDHICNRKQDVVYNILDWPSRTGSKVVVITIANTMDLPERVLRGCVTSRMGLTRLVFKPYTFQQLQEIIMNRLIGNSSFDPDAVQLVARKVAAVSGDARRALDVCRRAIDLIKSEDESQFITINHVNQVLNSIMSGVRVTAIRQCSVLEQFFLRALRDETSRTGFDHSTIDSVYVQMKNICLLEGEELPNDQQVIMMAYRLRDSGLIFLEKKRWDVFRKVSLNVSPEDICYALDKYNI